MAIQIWCSKCKLAYKLGTQKCSRCGEVFSHMNRKYRVCVSVDKRRVTRVFGNLTMARDAEAAIKADMLRGEYEFKKDKAPTLADVWVKYIEHAKANKATWHDDQCNYQKHLEPRFGNKHMDKITAFEIEKMKIELGRATTEHGKPYAKATIKHQLVLLRRLFNVAAKWGLYAGDNPVSKVSLPKLDNQVTEYFSDEETERLLAVLDEWPFRDSACFVKFAMLTGLRRGELFNLRWADIDFEQCLLTLAKPKGGKTITIPVDPAALDILRELPVVSEFVFPGKGGRRRTDFQGPWRRIRKAAGLPEHFRFHGLRHNFASKLVSSGVDLGVVSQLLTHKDLATTQRYAHMAPGVLRAAASKAAKVILPRPINVVPITKNQGGNHEVD